MTWPMSLNMIHRIVHILYIDTMYRIIHDLSLSTIHRIDISNMDDTMYHMVGFTGAHDAHGAHKKLLLPRCDSQKFDAQKNETGPIIFYEA